MSDEFKITPGSKYSVVFTINEKESKTLNGTYKGMAAIGADTALVFDINEAQTFIVASRVIMMTLLEAAPEEPEKKKPEPSSVYYG